MITSSLASIPRAFTILPFETPAGRPVLGELVEIISTELVGERDCLIEGRFVRADGDEVVCEVAASRISVVADLVPSTSKVERHV